MNVHSKLAEAEELAILRGYSEGRIGMRAAIAKLDYDGFADLLIAIGKAGLQLPSDPDTPESRAEFARARELLMPLLIKNRDASH
jgi:hypothetical protein